MTGTFFISVQWVWYKTLIPYQIHSLTIDFMTWHKNVKLRRYNENIGWNFNLYPSLLPLGFFEGLQIQDVNVKIDSFCFDSHWMILSEMLLEISFFFFQDRIIIIKGQLVAGVIGFHRIAAIFYVISLSCLQLNCYETQYSLF